MSDLGFDFDLKVNPRARRISISVHPDLRVVVSTPSRTSMVVVKKFVQKHADWVRARLEKFRQMPKPKFVPGGSKKDYENSKEEARKFVKARIKYFNEFYRARVGRISIRNQKTRWGSCSVDGNLSFNYKLVRMPIRMADYIIVHELCHILQFDHSPRFWALVERAIPEYKKIRKQLQGQGVEIE